MVGLSSWHAHRVIESFAGRGLLRAGAHDGQWSFETPGPEFDMAIGWLRHFGARYRVTIVNRISSARKESD